MLGDRVVLRGHADRVSRVERCPRTSRVQVVYFDGSYVAWTARELRGCHANALLDRAPADPLEWRRAELDQRRRAVARALAERARFARTREVVAKGVAR